MRYGRLAGHTLAPSRRPRPTRYSLIAAFWRTPARWRSDMSTSWSGSAEGGSAAWPSPRMAQPKRQRRSSMGVRRVGGRCSRGGGDVAVLHRELDGRARVRRVLLRAGELREDKCLPGTSTLTALETVSGPGYCLITSMPRVWSVVFCVEEGFLDAMRAVLLRFARRRCTPYSRAPPV